MPNGLAPHFIAKYVGPYEILHKPHLNVYTLKLSINFVAHLTFHVSKFKFMIKGKTGNKSCNQKWMPLNPSQLLKSKAYSMQGKHTLEARNI